MPWPTEVLTTLKRLNNIKRLLKNMFVDRDTTIDLLVLATVCHEHLLLIGSPGTAKTELVTRFTHMMEAKGFHYLLTRFTEPSELFGPLDLQAFQQGTFQIRTEAMLPEVQIAFLDEVFQGSSAILNTLLTLVNERLFYNGAQRQRTPLISVIGASNALPDDPWLQAFADRFALRLQIEPVADNRLDDLISQGWELELQRIETAQSSMVIQAAPLMAPVQIADVIMLHTCLREINVRDVQPVYANVIRELRAEGIELSDRRVIKGLKLIAGAALLREADTADVQDFWPLYHFWSRLDEADVTRTTVQPRIAEAGGPLLDNSRPATDILEDINVLQVQESQLRGEASVGAHLMALNRLRHEVLRDHRNNIALRQQIENAIQHNLARLEHLHV